LLNWWTQYADEIGATIAGVHHRWERAERLLRADALVYRAEDAGDETALAAARGYRQALRDVPQLPGFPWAFDWPVPPDDDEVQNIARRDAVLKAVEDAAANPMPVRSMPADLLPLVTPLTVNADGTTGPALPPPDEPMRQYGNLEAHYARLAVSKRGSGTDNAAEPIVPVLGDLEGGPRDPTNDDELPHSPGYEESIPPNDGISEGVATDPEPPPFEPSPQPPIEALGQPDVQATIALVDDPLTKLQAFLAANPDVVTYIEDNTPAPEPQPDSGTTP
jgi:hypothetical protein